MVRAERAELMAAAERNAAEAAAAMREELAQSQTKAFERTVSGDAYENGMRHGRAAAEAATRMMKMFDMEGDDEEEE